MYLTSRSFRAYDTGREEEEEDIEMDGHREMDVECIIDVILDDDLDV